VPHVLAAAWGIFLALKSRTRPGAARGRLFWLPSCNLGEGLEHVREEGIGSCRTRCTRSMLVILNPPGLHRLPIY